MKTSFKELLKDKINLVSFWASVVFFLATCIIALIAYPHLPPYIPLYNKLAWGYARLGHTYEIVIPITLTLLLSISNILLARYLYEKYTLLARFLFLITCLISLFSCIFILKLTLIIL